MQFSLSKPITICKWESHFRHYSYFSNRRVIEKRRLCYPEVYPEKPRTIHVYRAREHKESAKSENTTEHRDDDDDV